MGSGPDRGQSPVEWGDFPSVPASVRPSVRSPLWAIQPGLRPSQPGLGAAAQKVLFEMFGDELGTLNLFYVFLMANNNF